MKKVLAIAIITTIALSGCGGTSGTSQQSEQTDNAIIENEEMEKTTDERPSHFTQQVIAEQDGVKISINEGDVTQSIFGPEISVLVENDSDIGVVVQCDKLSVNGYMVEPMFSCEVAAGKKANDVITLSESDLQKSGIGRIGKVEMNLYAINSDTWSRIWETTVSIETNYADKYEDTLTSDKSGETIYEGNGVKVVYQGIEDDSTLGKDIKVYIENNSDATLTLQCDAVSVNGFMVDPIFSSDVVAHKASFDEISLMSTDLEQNKITDIQDIELSLVIIDTDSFNRIATTEPIVISNSNN